MNSRTILAVITLIFIGILSWQLRWVLLVLFGSVVIGVALDVLIQKIQKILPIPRALALVVVLILLILSGIFILQLFVPELSLIHI